MADFGTKSELHVLTVLENMYPAIWGVRKYSPHN